jgi:hypothetical protein
MSVATDIAQVTTYLQDIEAYEHLGKWNPDQNASCAQKLVEADILLNALPMDHTTMSSAEIEKVAALMKRLQKAKDNMPLPPWSSSH